MPWPFARQYARAIFSDVSAASEPELREEHVVEPRRRQLLDLVRQLERPRVSELERRRVIERRHLPTHRLADLAPPVPEPAAPQPRQPVEHLLAGRIDVIRALGGYEDARVRLELPVPGKRHPVRVEPGGVHPGLLRIRFHHGIAGTVAGRPPGSATAITGPGLGGLQGPGPRSSGAARGAGAARGGRESADTRCAPRPGESDGRRAPRPPNHHRRLARALTGTCRPRPAHRNHGRDPGPIRFAGAAAHTALTSYGPRVRATVGARSLTARKRWITSIGDPITRASIDVDASMAPSAG